MYNSRKISQKLLATTVATIIASMTGAAYAAEAPAGDLEEIQVTGSRIRNQTTITTPTPVTAVTTAVSREPAR